MNIQENPCLKQATQKYTCQTFPTQQKSRNRKFQTQNNPSNITVTWKSRVPPVRVTQERGLLQKSNNRIKAHVHETSFISVFLSGSEVKAKFAFHMSFKTNRKYFNENSHVEAS